MAKAKDFWKAVEEISNAQRKRPKELRELAAVSKQAFHVERLSAGVHAFPKKPHQRFTKMLNYISEAAAGIAVSILILLALYFHFYKGPKDGPK